MNIISKYKDYLNTDIFVFQYHSDFSNTELEDLMPKEIILNSYEKAFKKIGQTIESEKIGKLLEERAYEIYSTEIKKLIEDDNQELFISTFKEIFNNSISLKIKAISSLEEFKKELPEYEKFGNKVIETLSGKGKELQNFHEKVSVFEKVNIVDLSPEEKEEAKEKIKALLDSFEK